MINRKIQYLIAILMVSICCINDHHDNRSQPSINDTGLEYPVIIQFGAYGKGDERPSLTLVVNQHKVNVTTRTKTSGSEMRKFVINSEDTRFHQLLSQLTHEHLYGSKRYYESNKVDGGSISITTNVGARIFTNVFPLEEDLSRIGPDTTGPIAYEEIYEHAQAILQNHYNK